MLEDYASILNGESILMLLDVALICGFWSVIILAISPLVLRMVKKKCWVIVTIILLIMLAAAFPAFHMFLFVTFPEFDDFGLKGSVLVFVTNLIFGSLIFELITRPFLLKAWYGKEAYQEMITAPDNSEKIVVYSHAVAVKILGSILSYSVWLLVIVSITGPLFFPDNARMIALWLLFTVLFEYFFHLYVTQHLFKCDCCGRKALHSAYEHPVYPESWVRQLHPIAVNNCFRCVFCRVQYALSRKTLNKLQQKQAEQKRVEKEKGQVSEQ